MIPALISAADVFEVLAISRWAIFWRERSRFLPAKVKCWHAMLAISATLSASVGLAEDFKTVSGKVYKDATVVRVEADGIQLKTKAGISKVYFVELPQEVQERFHWAKPEPPREPFYGRWATAAEDPATLARIIAIVTSVMASVGLIINYIRSRRKPTTLARRASPRKAFHRGHR